MNERKKLKKKLAELKHLKNQLPIFIDCSEVYGDNTYTEKDLVYLNDQIRVIEMQIQNLKT